MTKPLLERQKEREALRSAGALLVEQVNGRFRAHLDEPLAKVEAICGKLAGEFADIGGQRFADEIRGQLKVGRI
jgi:hypothetical protein